MNPHEIINALYRTSQRARELMARLEQEDDPDLRAMLEGEQLQVQDMLLDLRGMAADYQAQIEWRQNHLRVLQEQKKRYEKLLEQIDEVCVEAIEARGGTVELCSEDGEVVATLGLRKSQRVNPYNESVIPKQYFREETVVKLDKKQLRADLMAGEHIDGAELETHVKPVLK